MGVGGVGVHSDLLSRRVNIRAGLRRVGRIKAEATLGAWT